MMIGMPKGGHEVGREQSRRMSATNRGLAVFRSGSATTYRGKQWPKTDRRILRGQPRSMRRGRGM